MKYIVDILGVKTHTAQWDGTAKLPYYLIDSYDFKRVTLDGVSCLFMKPKDNLDTLTALKKHIAKVHETEQLPIVLELDSITAMRRKSLINARIPFVATHCQIYLPFMGIALEERYSSEKKTGKTLMPSSQLLFFYFMYQKESELHASGMAKKLNLSPMQVSRSIRQLKELGLLSVRKDGVRMVLYSSENPRELFERSIPNLLNPVRKKIYTDKASDELPLSGISALAGLSMLNPPATKTVAFFGKAGELEGTDTLIDNDVQIEVEIWKYNPALLSERHDVVDMLSLAVSLQKVDDERVEQVVQELLEGLRREYTK